MTTRRDFLKSGVGAAAGLVFCGCGMVHRASAQQPARQALPVTVAGKRIKTIDVHSHCHFHEAGALVGADAPKLQIPPVIGAEEAFITVEKRLAAMDSQAIDMEVLSINPFWYNRERDLAAQIVKIQNEKLAELCASKPDRFAAFASLTLQAPDLAVQELETGTVSGDARLHVTPTGHARLHLESMSGDVRLYVPENLSAHVDASTFSGDIHSDFGKVQTKDRGPGSSLEAKVGNGDAEIDMQSFSGSLELRKSN